MESVYSKALVTHIKPKSSVHFFTMSTNILYSKRYLYIFQYFKEITPLLYSSIAFPIFLGVSFCCTKKEDFLVSISFQLLSLKPEITFWDTLTKQRKSVADIALVVKFRNFKNNEQNKIICCGDDWWTFVEIKLFLSYVSWPLQYSSLMPRELGLHPTFSDRQTSFLLANYSIHIKTVR